MFGEWVQAVSAKASGAIFVDGIKHINLTRPTPKKSLGQKLVDYSPLHIFTGRIDSCLYISGALTIYIKPKQFNMAYIFRQA